MDAPALEVSAASSSIDSSALITSESTDAGFPPEPRPVRRSPTSSATSWDVDKSVIVIERRAGDPVRARRGGA
jgi:hypothetical protein